MSKLKEKYTMINITKMEANLIFMFLNNTNKTALNKASMINISPKLCCNTIEQSLFLHQPKEIAQSLKIQSHLQKQQ